MVASLACAQLACTHSATFTTARALPRGRIQQVAALELGATHLLRDEPVESGDFAGGREELLPHATPSYSLRGGVTDRVELGGKLAVGTVEVNAKLQLLDTRLLAIAIAPRFAAVGLIPFGPPYLARAPLLVTLQATHWFSWTVRGGPAAIFGPAQHLIGGEVPLHDFLGELGSTWMVHVAPKTWLALEASILGTPGSSRVIAPSFGIGVLFGPSSTQEQRR